jgi:hypothetical protein
MQLSSGAPEDESETGFATVLWTGSGTDEERSRFHRIAGKRRRTTASSFAYSNATSQRLLTHVRGCQRVRPGESNPQFRRYSSFLAQFRR